MANNKIRIRLKSFDHKILDASAEKIVAAAKKSGAQVVGPVPLPTEKEVYTILRAVHKYKLLFQLVEVLDLLLEIGRASCRERV